MNRKRKVVQALIAGVLVLVLTTGFALAASATVTASSLRLRSKASTSSATVTIVPKGTEVTVLEDAGNGWYKVTYNGRTGYMASEWLKLESEKTEVLASTAVTTSSLRLRSKASISSATLSTAPKGTEVTVLDDAGSGWYKVTYNGRIGYMSGDWLELGPEESETPDTTPAAIAEATGITSTETTPAETTDDTAATETTPAEVIGTVNASSLNVRSGPGTTYDKIGSLKKGSLVSIESSVNGWYKITSGSVTGYVSADYIKAGPVKATVNTSSLNIRSGPGTSYSRVGSLTRGASVSITDCSVKGWYKITSGSVTGYVASDYISLPGSTSTTTSSKATSAASIAKSLVGKRYAYGAAGPNAFDCSGLVYYVYKQLGYTLARGSSSQYRQNGKTVSLSNIQPGDLVFFYDKSSDSSGGKLPTTHVGIYVGNGKFVHAANRSRGVVIDDLNSSYYSSHLVGVKRIL